MAFRPLTVDRRIHARLILTLLVLALVVISLIAGGLYLRSVVVRSVRGAERVRVARILVAEIVREQLDEETGMRGYVAARGTILLEPYYNGRATLPASLGKLRGLLTTMRLNEAFPPLADATQANARWLAEVAFPLLTARRPSTQLEVRGKAFIDRFRRDMATVDGLLARREASSDQRVERAILGIGLFAAAAVAAVVVAAVLFTVQQYRLAIRLERERAESEEQRRRTAEMSAAYEAEKRIADTLQEAFAQRALPDLGGLKLSARYAPASEEARVGGDWYDAVALPEERLLIAIGDVTGHGIDAAVAMNAARQHVISAALIDPDPGRILSRVNAELYDGVSPVITAIVGLVDAPRCRVAYAAAGHPAPVLIEPGRPPRLLGVGSLPLGIARDTIYIAHEVQTEPGAMLVFYTDGVIEYSRDVVRGEADLLDAVRAVAASPETDAARGIYERIFSRHMLADDVAILTVRFVPLTVPAFAGESGAGDQSDVDATKAQRTA